MGEIRNLGYVILGVRDLARWREFAAVLGFQEGRTGSGSLALRMDQHMQRVILQESPADDILAAGWEFEDVAMLEPYVDRLRARGLKVEALGDDLVHARCVQKAYKTLDPNGLEHEFYVGPGVCGADNAFVSPVLACGGFRTGALGLGHILVRARNYRQSLDFYQEVLGFRLSDRIRQEFAPGRVIDATFLHTRTGRHHSLGTAETPGNTILNHLMVEVDSMDDVGMAYDRCIAAGYQMRMELGHHPNDRVFSFYAISPSGFAVEYGWGGVVINEIDWKPTTYDRLSDWGHKRKDLA